MPLTVNQKAEDETNSDSEESGEEYQVESILKHRRERNGVVLYLVKWIGYSVDESTWEPEDNLTNCAAVLTAYQSQHMKRSKKKRRMTDTSDEEFKDDSDEDYEEGASKRKKKVGAKLHLSSVKVRPENEWPMYASPPSIHPPSVGVDDNHSDNGRKSSSDSKEEDATLPDLISTTNSSSSPSLDTSGSSDAMCDGSKPSECDRSTGWDRGWSLKKVLGVTRYPDNSLWVLVAWQDHEPELVPSQVANEMCPQNMIEYYEQRLQWKMYSAPGKK